MNESIQTVISAVTGNLGDTNLTPLVEPVVKRLVSFGYSPTEDDVWVITFSIQKAANHVLNEINQNEIPKGLTEVAVDMSCGEFLNAKYLSGQLEIGKLDLSGIVETIKEGDTSVSFKDGSSDEEKLNALIGWMTSGKETDFLCFRKMRW